ncbi:MAG: ISC system 2Fe-2S type ferredoxin [Pseudomonadota bacterium]|nr:ISC system 2Fe-2S type ferredoxin [Pseudomonadota bacterium]HJO36599.1 ISC system 2Fe-2S type ferredoxin [Gammaproteobacteria bacterium]
MPRLTVLPHPQLCPDGASVEAAAGARLSDALLAAGVAIEHACERACVCTTCHVVIREGFAALRTAGDDEEDQLGRAWGLEPTSRLSCQVRLPADAELVVEIPRYSRNFVREHD